MDLYKISYDVRRPEMDAITITKDSKFAIQFQFVKDENFTYYVEDNNELERPALHLKKADGTTTTLYTSKHIDTIVDGDGIYLWTMEEKFDSDVSCYIDYYQYYYNEETEEEWDKEIKDCCICQIKCKDSSIAYNAVSPTPYTEANSIKAGLNSKNSGVGSVAIGQNSNGGDSSVAVGGFSSAMIDGIAIGLDSKSTQVYAIAMGIGAEAKSRESIAIGKQAKISEELPDRIQLGTGTLSAANVLMQVKDYPLLDKHGKIIADRVGDLHFINIIGTEGNVTSWQLGTQRNIIGDIIMEDTETLEHYSVSIKNGQLAIRKI